MKSIILAGAPRSGKTNLTRTLQKETGFSRISGDAFMCTFQAIYPELGINEDDPIEVVSKRLENFMVVYLKHLVTYEHVPFILDTVHFMPEQVARLKLQEKYNILFFGYPAIDPEQKLKDIRNHKTSHYDWTDEKSDDELVKNIHEFIKHSRVLQEQCLTYGLNFVDTSNDFAAALNKAHSLLV